MTFTCINGLLAVGLLAIALPARAEWSYSELNNQARGETTYFAKTTSLPDPVLTAKGVELEFSMLKGVNRNNLAFRLQGGWLNCFAPNFCDIRIRFDDGKAIETKAGNSVQNIQFLMVKGSNALFKAVLLAKSMQVELPVSEMGQVRFTFDLSNFRWKQDFLQVIR